MDSSHLKGKILYGSNVVVRDVKLGDAGHSTRNARGASNVLFERCRFRGGGGTGSDSYVVLFGDGTNSCDHITLRDCQIECNLGVEDSSFSKDFNNMRITENGISGGAHVDSITLERCHFGVSNGIRSGCPRMDIEAYTWDGGTGHVTHGWSNLKIVDCVFEVSDWYNIDLADDAKDDGTRASGPALVSGCTLKGGKNYTLCIESPKGVVIENNIIYRASNNTLKMGCGDMSSVNPGTIFRNNTIDLATNQGLALGSPAFFLKGGDNRFTGNVVRTTSSSRIFELQQARNNIITGNFITMPATATLFVIDDGCSGNLLTPNTVN